MDHDRYKDQKARKEYIQNWRKSPNGKASGKKTRDREEAKAKRNAYMAEYRMKNRAKLRQKQQEYYDKISRKIEEYKLQYPCKCGESDPVCLVFHHRDPKTKSFGIGSWRKNSWSWDSVLVEIKKCDIMCSNCHLKLHAKLSMICNQNYS